jgi:NAD(P)-dependent dehydrogenase (short-subunit alcohol dehydrogenase family)
MGKLDNKVALVTGGTSGIGLATAKRFAAEGAQVYITGRRQKELDAAAREIGKGVVGVQGDVSNLADLDRLMETIKKQKGRLDTLFANAGGGAFGPMGMVTEEHYEQIFNNNVKGTVFTVQKAIPLMPEGSTIVLMASVAGVKGMPAFSLYSGAKAAVRNFARGWSVDLKDKRIRVNAVSPGLIPTPGYNTMGLTNEQIDGFVASMLPSIPQNRAGTPDDVAKAVLFLASDDSSYVNGAELFVDGGMAQI